MGAESVRPLAPVGLVAATDPSGDLQVSWIRRSRAGFAWLDEVDAPVGETRERYRLTVAGEAAAIDLTTDEAAALIPSSDLQALGGAAATIEVRQIGDLAASRPAQLTIDLSQGAM